MLHLAFMNSMLKQCEQNILHWCALTSQYSSRCCHPLLSFVMYRGNVLTLIVYRSGGLRKQKMFLDHRDQRSWQTREGRGASGSAGVMSRSTPGGLTHQQCEAEARPPCCNSCTYYVAQKPICNVRHVHLAQSLHLHDTTTIVPTSCEACPLSTLHRVLTSMILL